MRKTLFLAVVVVSSCAVHSASVLPADVFLVGQWYRFDFGRAAMPDGSIPTEVLQVKAKRADGWLLVVGLDGSEWTINPATVVAFRPVVMIQVKPANRQQAGA